MEIKDNIKINITEDNDNSKKKTSGKYKSVKKTITGSGIVKIHDSASQPHHIHLITRANFNTESQNRLMSPVDAERKKALGKKNAQRKLIRPTRHLTLKAAPIVPTAPKDTATRTKNWLISQAKIQLSSIDITFCILGLLLCIIGVISIYSATLTFSSLRFIVVQSAAVLLGVFVMLALSFVDYRQFISKYRLIIFINAAILIATFIFGRSVTETSNVNWIDLGFIKIQPSEFAKLLFIYSFAVHLDHVRDRLNKLSTVFTLFVHAGLIFALVLLQKDLGSLTVFMFIFIAMCFAAGLSVWYYIAGAVASVCVSPFVWAHLSTYQKERILLCFDESIDPLGIGIRYQQLRSQTAIGNGGLTGTGFTNGTVTQALNGHLPAKHTDMIFSTISEEWGLIGAFVILVITGFFIFRIIKIALGCQNLTGKYICVGIASMFIIQVIENVGMCLGIMPVIGITYPFLSYGGSSLLSSFIAAGFVLSVCVHEEKTFFM